MDPNISQHLCHQTSGFCGEMMIDQWMTLSVHETKKLDSDQADHC